MTSPTPAYKVGALGLSTTCVWLDSNPLTPAGWTQAGQIRFSLPKKLELGFGPLLSTHAILCLKDGTLPHSCISITMISKSISPNQTTLWSSTGGHPTAPGQLHLDVPRIHQTVWAFTLHTSEAAFCCLFLIGANVPIKASGSWGRDCALDFFVSSTVSGTKTHTW